MPAMPVTVNRPEKISVRPAGPDRPNEPEAGKLGNRPAYLPVAQADLARDSGNPRANLTRPTEAGSEVGIDDLGRRGDVLAP